MPRGTPGAHNEGAIDRQVELLGARVRALRRAQSLTLVQVAELAGLSHPFLSQVENGRARPSFASLDRIARALGTTQVELFAALAESAPPVVPASGVVVIDDGIGVSGPFAEGSARVLLAGASFTPMEFVARNREFGEYFVHDEEEFCYVVDGLVEGDFGGAESRILQPGQAFFYRGGTPHRWRSPDGGVYRVLVVQQRIVPTAGPSADATPDSGNAGS